MPQEQIQVIRLGVGRDGRGLKVPTSFHNVRTEKHPGGAMGQLLSDAVVEADPGARSAQKIGASADFLLLAHPGVRKERE